MKTNNYNSIYYQWNKEKGSLHNLELVFCFLVSRTSRQMSLRVT